jgi:YbgC/YbaW family acyl-CoA thioester hydrolase
VSKELIVATTFEYRFQVLEKHLDSFGHVNNAVYLELFEEARWDFIHARGFGLEEIKKQQMGPVLLELNLRFKRELLNREWITITSSTPQEDPDGNKLISTLQQKMMKEDGKVAATLDLKVALMDMQKRKLVMATPQWLHAIGVD